MLERLRTLTAELSGYDAKDLVETASFLELGFDSLFLTQLAGAYQNAYGLKITFRQLFDELPSLSALSSYIDANLPPEAQATPTEAPPPPVAAPIGESNLAATAAAPPPGTQVAPSIDFTPLAFPLNADGGGLQSVMAQQLALMSQQLQVLRSLKGGAAPAARVIAPAPAAVPVPQAATPAPSTSASAVPAAAAPAPAAEAPSLPKGFGPQISRDERVLAPRQAEHLARLTARYNARTRGSKQQTQANRAHFADPRTAAGFNRLWKEMVYPIVVTKSSGCNLWDIDGNKYIDILNGFGPNFLGHSPPFIREALKEQLDKGVEVGPQTPLAGEAARLFCELTGMDRVSWVNTGSEAVQAAIRLSRTVTGRNKIVVFQGDYHGNFDEVLVRVVKSPSGARRTMPLAPGIPFRAVEDVFVLDYGTDEALETIRQNAGEIAAVLVEPVQSRRPDFQPREFLHALRKLTSDEGIVLVFDEVITGFRICPGGAQQYYGVEADLATYGKIIGGGMPIGVVAGRSRFMDTFDGGQWRYGDDSFPSAGVTFFAGTFVRHPLAITAAHATLNYLKAQGPALQEGVNRRTTYMTGELNRFFEERGVKIRIPHFSSQMFIKVTEDSDLATLLFYHLRDRGIHVLEGFPSYMTAAHTDADVETIIAAFKDSVLEMQADGLLPQPDSAPALATWKRSFPLTDGQREIWVASQMGEMATCAFNESDSVVIEGPLDAALFRESVAGVLARHEAFHLRFDADGAMQRVDENATFETTEIDLSSLGEAQRQEQRKVLLNKQALTPFDLENGPLVRTFLFKLGPQRNEFVIYCHHIVFDGYSSELVIRDIAKTYNAAVANEAAGLEPTVPYSVFVYRTQRRDNDADAAASLDYWRSVYAEELPPPLDLPVDRARKAVRTYAGATAHRELDPALSAAVRETAKSLKSSVYALLLSGFQTLLSRLSGQEDVVVGIPTAGQARQSLDTVGYCVNALPVRSTPAHAKPFNAFVQETQKAMLDAFDHQDTSLGELVRALRIPRDSSRLPLVEAIFNYSRYFSDLEIAGCKLATRENKRQAVYYDLFFNIIESDGRLIIDWDYCSDLLDAETVDRWIDHYTELLKGIVDDPGQALGDLPLVSAQQGAEVAAMWGQQ
ncbi:MAG TPA: aminotransferase class III-fold pyridoxal phosphate-dependent enzyme [Rhodanobacteraceae bacterium]|nr:aminotransferase class III-fold pyridoxal phosphate-dependent enzyme [Rhodanobacteraceae bacterium]